jgi:HSP20 family protein
MTLREIINLNPARNVAVTQRNTFGRSFFSLQDDMNRLFQDFFGEDPHLFLENPLEQLPAIDLVENDNDFQIKAALAGIDPEDVEVTCTDGYLTIKGNHKEEAIEESGEKDEYFLRKEISRGSFRRTVPLPTSANFEKADARFKNGILSIAIPKKAEALKKPKRLEIKRAA